MLDPQSVGAWLAAFGVGTVLAFGIWGAGHWLRGVVLGAALLPMLPPELLPLPELARQAGLVALMAVFGITLSLDRLDPVIMRSLAACGAGPWRRFRIIVLPALALPCLYAGLAMATRAPRVQLGAAAALLAWSLITAAGRRPA